MLQIKREKFADWYKEALPLLAQHWQELCIDTEKLVLDPHIEAYLYREIQGELMLLVMRLNDHMIGYYLGFLVQNLHYRQIRCNYEDIFWVHPERRNGTYALRLFEEVQKENLRENVQFWKCTAKINTQAPKFLERMGFKKFEECFYQWVK
jgi:GNAT superfamily N-acetyltransferase